MRQRHSTEQRFAAHEQPFPAMLTHTRALASALAHSFVAQTMIKLDGHPLLGNIVIYKRCLLAYVLPCLVCCLHPPNIPFNSRWRSVELLPSISMNAAAPASPIKLPYVKKNSYRQLTQ